MALSVIMFSSTGIIASAALVFSPVLSVMGGVDAEKGGETYDFVSKTIGHREGGPKVSESEADVSHRKPNGNASMKDQNEGKTERGMGYGKGKSRTIRYEGDAKIHRSEIVTERGRTYRDCEFIESDAHGLTFRHRDGMAKIGYQDMRKEMQGEFGYDPAWEKQALRERSEKAVRRPQAKVSARPGGGTFGYNGEGGQYLGYGYGPGGYPVIGTYGYTARLGSTNPAFSTNTLRQIVSYRNNGYSNISLSEQLYNNHFAAHAGVVYGNSQLRPAVIAAPPYMPYVRNIYPRQIGTFAAGPSGGGLVPTLRSGYSQAGTIAPSLVPATRR
jgi:hypothetical protein